MPLRPKSARAKSLALAAAGAAFVALPLIGGSAAAIPVPKPRSSPLPSPSPETPATATTLPFGYEVLFVLDDEISSASSKGGDVVHMHLRNPLVAGGRTVAPAGAPATLRIVNSSAARMLDTYGFVDVYVEPLRLSDGREIPLGVASTRLAPRDTTGHQSTVEIEDTIEDIVVPYAGLYQIFRRGKNFVIHPGAELRAHLDATVVAAPGVTIIETPRPFRASLQTPRATFQALPLAEPIPHAPPPATVAPRPTPIPSATPTTVATPS